MYSKWVPTKTVEDWSRFVREAYWRKEGRSWWLGDLEMGYSRGGRAVEGDGVVSGFGPGVVGSSGPGVSAERRRMFCGGLGYVERMEDGVGIQRIRSGARIILMSASDLCLTLDLESQVSGPAL